MNSRHVNLLMILIAVFCTAVALTRDDHMLIGTGLLTCILLIIVQILLIKAKP